MAHVFLKTQLNKNMENGNNIEEVQEVALVKQADSTVKILQEDDLKTLKEALDKVTNFKRRYSVKKLTVTDITNKEQKEKLRLAIGELRTTRTSLEKDKKAKTAPYRDTVAYINENFDKAIDAISKIEDPLKDYKKEIDDKVEALEKEEELKKQAVLNERVDKLIKAGIVFHPDSSYYVIGSEEFEIPVTSFDAADIQSMTDKIFEGQLAIVTEKSETIARLTAEKKQREDEAKAKEIEDARIAKEKFDLEQAELKRQQEEFQKQQADFKRQQDELAAKQKELQEAQEKEEQRKQIQEQQRIQAIVEKRKEQLIALGLTEHSRLGAFGLEEEVYINSGQILDTTGDWDAIISSITPEIEKHKEKIRIRGEEKKKAEEKRIADKAIEDKRLADLAEEKRKADNLAKSSDSNKWAAFIEYLKNVPVLEMESDEYKAKYKNALAVLTAIK